MMGMRPGAIGVDTALATLSAGTLFLGAGHAIVGRYHAKVIGNGLRELDRFLNILIDEVATLVAPGLDLADMRNTANKLRALRAATGRASPEHGRLRAIGRSRDCLFHCGGVVRRADRRGGGSMTAGWPPSAAGSEAPALVLALGERLVVSPVDLDRVCRFYEMIAAGLAAQAASIDFSRRSAYIGMANVACDGI